MAGGFADVLPNAPHFLNFNVVGGPRPEFDDWGVSVIFFVGEVVEDIESEHCSGCQRGGMRQVTGLWTNSLSW